MAISSRHPMYSTYLTDWQLCRDSYRGERIVKEAGQKYLPATSGQQADGMSSTTAPGYLAYKAYKERAVFPDYFSEAVETYIGFMWSKPPTIELPSAMEPMLKKATTKGEGLEQLLRRINEQQLVTGRVGLLLDLPAVPDPSNPMPYIAVYNAEHIINWDNGTQLTADNLNLVVLDESEFERNADFEWEWVNKYRALVLGEVLDNETKGNGTYRTGVFEDVNANFNEAQLIEPSIRGNRLNRIPFSFINTKDVVAEPDDPPLSGLARLCMTIYRGEADYRQSLFLQGQDTLVTIGASDEEDEPLRIGAGSMINLPQGGDAKFIGVTSEGLGEQRQALENDRMKAGSQSGDLIDTRSKEKESGDALTQRIAAQTATLNQIARSGAEGLQNLLRVAAEWMGMNPEEVIVTPNLDFTNNQMTGKDLGDLVVAKNLGAPLSKESIHKIMQDKNLTCMSFEEEMDLLDEEGPDLDDDPTDDQ